MAQYTVENCNEYSYFNIPPCLPGFSIRVMRYCCTIPLNRVSEVSTKIFIYCLPLGDFSFIIHISVLLHFDINIVVVPGKMKYEEITPPLFKTIQLVCNTNERVQWFFNGNPIQWSEDHRGSYKINGIMKNTLILYDLKEKHLGVYICFSPCAPLCVSALGKTILAKPSGKPSLLSLIYSSD